MEWNQRIELAGLTLTVNGEFSTVNGALLLQRPCSQGGAVASIVANLVAQALLPVRRQLVCSGRSSDRRLCDGHAGTRGTICVRKLTCCVAPGGFVNDDLKRDQVECFVSALEVFSLQGLGNVVLLGSSCQRAVPLLSQKRWQVRPPEYSNQ